MEDGGYPADFQCRVKLDCNLCGLVSCIGPTGRCWRLNEHTHKGEKDEGTVCHHYHGELLEPETGICATHFTTWQQDQPSQPVTLFEF